MKNLSLTFCLVIAALLGSVGVGFACDLTAKSARSCWDSDICTQAVRNGVWDTRLRYKWAVNEAKRRGLTCGISKRYPPRSVINSVFYKLSKEQRKQLQSNLKNLGFYKSSIDGLYGKGTAGALTAYNKQNLKM